MGLSIKEYSTSTCKVQRMQEKLKMEVALPLKEALTVHPSSMAVWFSG
jgi:hypothetical protein